MKKSEIKNLEIFYQPKVNLKSNEFIGAEALARFLDENGNFINTELVINLAKNYTEMSALTTAVINKVISDFKYIEKLNKKLIYTSINISSVEVENDNLISWINELFNEDYKKYIKYIEFEITEQHKVLNVENLKSGILYLQSLGFNVSIDDLGSGYNTTDILNIYDVNFIKLDKSLTKSILENNLIDELCNLRKLIDIAHISNKKVVAEGIENKFTYKMLCFLNCDYGQGFYMSKPIPITQLIDLIDKNLFTVA